LEQKYWNPKMETMPLAEKRELQMKRLGKELRYVYGHSAFYHKIFDETNLKPDDIKTLDDFYKKFPDVTKQQQRDVIAETGDPFYGNLCVPKERLYRIIMTSGTTGLPTFPAFTKNDIEIEAEQIARNWWTLGCRPGDAIHGFNPSWHAVGTPGARSMEMIGARCFITGMDALIRIPFHQCIDRFLSTGLGLKPRVVTAPVDVFTAMLSEMKERNIPITEMSKAWSTLMLTTGIITKGTREMFRTTGCSTRELYAVQDALLFTIECEEEAGWHIAEDLFILENVDPETGEHAAFGEKGEFWLTELYREATPLIRFHTDDAGTFLTDEDCACGRTGLRGHCYGRLDWYFKIKGYDGTLAPDDLEDIIKAIPGAESAEYTILRDAPVMDILKIKMTCDTEKVKDLEAFKKKVASEIEKELGIKAEIQIVDIGELPITGWKIHRLIDIKKEN